MERAGNNIYGLKLLVCGDSKKNKYFSAGLDLFVNPDRSVNIYKWWSVVKDFNMFLAAFFQPALCVSHNSLRVL